MRDEQQACIIALSQILANTNTFLRSINDETKEWDVPHFWKSY